MGSTDAVAGAGSGDNAVGINASRRRVRSFPKTSKKLREVIRYPKKKGGRNGKKSS